MKEINFYNVAGLMAGTTKTGTGTGRLELKKHPSQVTFKDFGQRCRTTKFQNIFSRTTPFAEQHSVNTSKAKQETATHNSVKFCFSFEKS